MKINTQKLRSALSNLKPIFGGRATFPILGCVKIEASSGVLSIVATNLTEWQCEQVEASGMLDTICVNFNRLDAALGGEEVEITCDDKRMTVKFGRSETNLNVLPEEQFAAMPITTPNKAVGVPLDILAKSCKTASYACHKAADGRPNLESVYIGGEPKRLRCIATDGRSFCEVSDLVISADFECSIHQNFIGSLAHAMTKPSATLSLGDSWATIKHESGFYMCRLSEELFHIDSAQEILSMVNEQIGEIDIKATKEALRGCLAILPPERACDCLFQFKEDGLTISYQGDGNDFCSFELPGEYLPWKQNINAKYVLDALCKIDNSTCKVFKANSGNGLAFIWDNFKCLIAGMTTNRL